MLKDGVISAEESDQLEAVQDQLGLTDQQASEIMHLIKQRQGSVRCPHCGHTLCAGTSAAPLNQRIPRHFLRAA